jgi:hypothetical protein
LICHFQDFVLDGHLVTIVLALQSNGLQTQLKLPLTCEIPLAAPLQHNATGYRTSRSDVDDPDSYCGVAHISMSYELRSAEPSWGQVSRCSLQRLTWMRDGL